ncbi:superoxide dismutase [Streptomyces sp. NPDC051907]|uniref:SMP-30/gluconolactonase/LRE family protein n=1 Tax=Streptomyces sp. NPDC051907 TaxID=3155284 RepID=UPI0034381A92
MTRSFARRGVLQAAAAIGGSALVAPLGGVARAAGTAQQSWPTRFPLPDGFQPEGIAIGSTPYAYFGSIANGDVYRVSLATGRGSVVSQGLGPDHPVIGLKIDRRQRLLFLCGGTSREIRVADVRTGKLLKTYTVGSGKTMVNDVVLTPRAAWFTDSFKPQLYRLPLDASGQPGDEVETVPLSGDWEQGESFTANGISRTPDGKALILVNAFVDGGSLMWVDPRNGVARRVRIGETKLPNGDGLLLLGTILYVVQQMQNAVDVLRLDHAGRSGESIARITDPRFQIPTTAAAWGDRIYLPNARFDVEPKPDTPYDAVAVDQVKG